jgi:biopolymer transport protein ExbB/TolQ
MEINLVELWANMGLPVKLVVIVLTLQAMACLAVLIDRVVLVTQSSRRARAFATAAQAAMEAGDYERVLALTSEAESNHLSSFLEPGLKTFLEQAHEGDYPERAAELAKRALERKGDIISRELNRYMNVLASTGSTAPFVGLLGTVLGIIHAFRLIAASGSGGIGTIGAAIGESLVVTGYGLIVAIPSVLVFNWLSGRIAGYEAMLLNAGSELVDKMEVGLSRTRAGSGASHPAPALGRSPALQQPPVMSR